MQIIHNTAGFDDTFVREVLRFVTPPGVTNYHLRLTATESRYRGWACYTTWLVTLRVGAARHFPCKGGWTHPGKGYLPAPWLASRDEALVYLAAHELRHLWQYRIPRGRRVWGARGQFSERDADAYAIKMLRAWRLLAS